MVDSQKLREFFLKGMFQNTMLKALLNINLKQLIDRGKGNLNREVEHSY